MKTLVIIISVLAVTMMVYGQQSQGLKNFLNNSKRCSEEWGGTLTISTGEMILCALKGSHSYIFNANGEFMKEVALQSLEDAFRYAPVSRMEKAKEIYSKCHDDAVSSGATGNEQSLKITTCSSQIYDLLDKN